MCPDLRQYSSAPSGRRPGLEGWVAAIKKAPGFTTSEITEALRAELQRLAGWLGLEKVAKAEKGDLAV